MQSKTRIVNLMGGPGIGKSTIASGIFHKLKVKKVSCELITEYAKEITWEETQKLLENQIHIFSEQFRRQWRLVDKVDFVISDSPLLLNSVYYDYYLEKLGDTIKFSPEYIKLSREFFDASFKEFNNIDFNIQRRFGTTTEGEIFYPDYDQNGRNQNIQESVSIDKKIQDKLYKYNPGYINVFGSEKEIVDTIVAKILLEVN